MRRSLLFLCLVTSLPAFSGCASEPAATTETVDSSAIPAATPPPSDDPLAGMWVGDWGPTAEHRNAVTLELKWNGASLTGMVNPGPEAVALTKASYARDTGIVMLEADAAGRGGEAVHFIIEGKLDGTTLSGSWEHDGKKGDFELIKS